LHGFQPHPTSNHPARSQAPTARTAPTRP
jgi:hypothetical protein